MYSISWKEGAPRKGKPMPPLKSPSEHGVDVRAVAPLDSFEVCADGVATEEVRPAEFGREGESAASGAPVEEAGEAQAAAVERGGGEGVEQVFLVGVDAGGKPIGEEEGAEELGAEGQSLGPPANGFGDHITIGRGAVIGAVAGCVEGGAESPSGVDDAGDLCADPVADDGALGGLVPVAEVGFTALAAETDVDGDDFARVGPVDTHDVFVAKGGGADARFEPRHAKDVGLTRELPARGGRKCEAEVEPFFVADAAGAREGGGEEGVVARRIVAVK